MGFHSQELTALWPWLYVIVGPYLIDPIFYSVDLMAVSAVMSAGKRLVGNDTVIFVTGQVRRELWGPMAGSAPTVDVGPGNRSPVPRSGISSREG
jgi:hypothetical protein